MSLTSEAIVRIDANTEAIRKDLATFKTELTEMHKEVDSLKLSRAKLDGQIDMLWKLVSLIGMVGIAALVKAFTP